MRFLDLPAELLHLILIQASYNRGIKRALRLRLVCKKLANAVHPALFETHLMDNKGGEIGTYHWNDRHQHGADKIWHQYLVYRVMTEKNVRVIRYVEIRNIAEAVCREIVNPPNLRGMVENLCWQALNHWDDDSYGRFWQGPGGWDNVLQFWENDPYDTDDTYARSVGFNYYVERKDQNLGLAMLSAAAHLNLLPLAERFIDEGHKVTEHNFLFAPPIQIAAQFGNVAMLDLFQKQLRGSEIEIWSVRGAAIRGDLNIMKLALPTTKVGLMKTNYTASIS